MYCLKEKQIIKEENVILYYKNFKYFESTHLSGFFFMKHISHALCLKTSSIYNLIIILKSVLLLILKCYKYCYKKLNCESKILYQNHRAGFIQPDAKRHTLHFTEFLWGEDRFKYLLLFFDSPKQLTKIWGLAGCFG